ncbi:MAG: CinA family protein, partial [Candidatus Omnitrophica bacterium]|nr:CinA family protein [Candidatus Omnitrophota bacterium]
MKMLGVVKLFVLPYNGYVNVETKVIRQLKLSQKTVSVAESCSGGLIAHRLTNVPGCSNVFVGAIIAYSNSVKQKNLQIPPQLIVEHGTVSKEVAQ